MRLLLLLILAFWFISPDLAAQQKTWTGTVDTLWDNPNNWSPSGVPGPGHDIHIPGTPVNQPFSADMITINSGDTMVIDTGATLTIARQFNGSDGLRVNGFVRNQGSLVLDRLGADGIDISSGGIFYNLDLGLIQVDSTIASGIFIRSGGMMRNWGRMNLLDADFTGMEIYGTYENYDSLYVANARDELIFADVDFHIINYGQILLNNAILGEALELAPTPAPASMENNGCGKIEVLSVDVITDSDGTLTNNSIIIDRSALFSRVQVNNGVIQNLNGGSIFVGTNNGTVTTQIFDDIYKVILTDDDDGGGSLRRVIHCAEEGDTLGFGNNLDNETIVLTSDTILLDKNLAFIAPSNVDVTVDAQQLTRLFHLPPGHTCTIDGMSMRSGSADEGGVIRNLGGLTLRNLRILQHPTPGSGSRISGNGEYLLEYNVDWEQ